MGVLSRTLRDAAHHRSGASVKAGRRAYPPSDVPEDASLYRWHFFLVAPLPQLAGTFDGLVDLGANHTILVRKPHHCMVQLG
jgi:hypothetical protein